MAQPKNLSPKFKIPNAEKELQLQMGQVPMASRQGGLDLFSNKFKRGYGDAVFGSDENGIWLGKAEFADAPFSVDMLGQMIASLITIKNSGGETVLDSKGIVSGTVFPFNIISGSGNQTLTTTLTDITGITVDFNLERAARVLFFAEARIEVQGSGDAYFVVRLDDSNICQPQGVRFIDQGDFYTQTTYDIVEVAAGDHTFKMMGRKSASPTASMVRDDSRIAYLVLGS